MDEQLRILKMVEEGTITAEQGAEPDGGHEHRNARKADCRGKEQL